MQRTTLLALKIITMAVIPALMLAKDNGPEPRRTGAPGDLGDCTGCHNGQSNPSGGSVVVTASGGETYIPGQRQRITVTINPGSNARRFGFQATARLVSNLQFGQAGNFQPANSETFVQCDGSGALPPCRDTELVQFIQHQASKEGNTFEFDWTPPENADAGPARIYVAANAANGDGRDGPGDRIFTANITLTPQASSGPPPAIQSQNGVINAATLEPGIVSGSWAAIRGFSLSSGTRIWLESDFNNGQAPTSLDGVRVNIDGKPAAVYFISPTQINVQVPELDKFGPVAVEVINANGTSNTASVNVQRAAPGWFMFDPEGRKYIAGTHVDGVFLGKAGLFGTALTTRPARPGDIIVLYGANFGPTNPPVPFGRNVSAASELVDRPIVTIGGIPATVGYGGAAPNLIGTYQFNITVPQVPNGDQPVVVTMTGVRTQENAFITVQR